MPAHWSTRRFLSRALIRGCAVSLALAVPALTCSLAQAAFPERPIVLVVSFQPATAADLLTRAIGQKMSETLGQTVMVENRPGAGGFIGLSYAAKARPDGHTIYMAAVSSAAIAAFAYSNPSVNLMRDFVPVAGVAHMPHLVVVPASLPVQNVSQLVGMFKAAPGQYNFASQGVGTLSHLEAEMFKFAAGVDVVHVPYKGSPQAMADVMAGTASMMFDSLPASVALVKSGKLRVLAVASGKRFSMLPNVPTLAESGLKGFEANNVFGVSAPKGTPPAVVATLGKAIRAAVEAPELQQRLQEQGIALKFTPAAEFGQVIEQEFRLWGQVVERARVRLD